MAMTWSLELGPGTSGHSTRQAPCEQLRHHHAQLAFTRQGNMAVKSYKDMKEAWVTGHTGSSVADVNSVSLAMPVPNTSFKSF
jgi:hypothetical protein